MTDAFPDLIEASHAWEKPLVERQLRRLDDLAERGLDIARACAAEAGEAGADLNAAAMAYARAARAVRLAVMLQSRIVADLKRMEDEAVEARFEREEGRKFIVERVVRRVAKSKPDPCETDEEAEDRLYRLMAETAERLDGDDLYGPILERPVAEVVALICKDLGLEPDWDVLGEEAWAAAPFLPREAAGGGPSAEEPMGEGEGGARPANIIPLRDSS